MLMQTMSRCEGKSRLACGLSIVAVGMLAAGIAVAQTQDQTRSAIAPIEASSEKATTFSAGEMAEIGARMQYGRAIIARLRPEAVSNYFTPDWDVALTARIYNVPSADLAKMTSLATYAEISAAVNGARRTSKTTLKDHGFGTNNLVFHSITPCRLLDTRVAIGMLPASTTRVVDTTSSTLGGAAGCATALGNADPVIGNNSAWGAIAANVTVANTGAGPAFLRLRPAGSANTSAFLNWTAANSQVANAGIIALADVGFDGQFEMFASSATDVIIDVLGAFGKTRQMTCSNVYNAADSAVDPDSTRNPASTRE